MKDLNLNLVKAVQLVKENSLIHKYDIAAITREICEGFKITDSEDAIYGLSNTNINRLLENLFNNVSKAFEERENKETTFEDFLTQYFREDSCTKALLIDVYRKMQAF